MVGCFLVVVGDAKADRAFDPDDPHAEMHVLVPGRAPRRAVAMGALDPVDFDGLEGEALVHPDHENHHG